MYDPDEPPKKKGRKPVWPWDKLEVGESFEGPLYLAFQTSVRGNLSGKKFRSEKISGSVCRITRMPGDYVHSRIGPRLKSEDSSRMHDSLRGIEIGEYTIYPRMVADKMSIETFVNNLSNETGRDFTLEYLSKKFVKITRIKDIDFEERMARERAAAERKRQHDLKNVTGYAERPWLSLQVGESFETRWPGAIEEQGLYERQARRSDNPKIWNLAYSLEILQKHPPHYKFTRTQ